jgi:hypothetical protein
METSNYYITVTEAAEALGVAPRTVRYHAQELGGFKQFGRWMLSADAVQQHMPPDYANDLRQMRLPLRGGGDA